VIKIIIGPVPSPPPPLSAVQQTNISILSSAIGFIFSIVFIFLFSHLLFLRTGRDFSFKYGVRTYKNFHLAYLPYNKEL
jgi:hypothetical protein